MRIFGIDGLFDDCSCFFSFFLDGDDEGSELQARVQGGIEVLRGGKGSRGEGFGVERGGERERERERKRERKRGVVGDQLR